jgi:hypothetical protein
MRRLRMLLVLGGAFFLMFVSIPSASADCNLDEVELARIRCPGPAGYIYVCQNVHSGLPLAHHHCRF